MKTPELERAEAEVVSTRTVNILHRSIGAGILVMSGIGVWLGTRAGLNVDRELAGWIFVFLAMSSGLHLLTLVILKQVLAHMAQGRYQPYCILRWVLVEGIAVYGLVLSMLSFPATWLAPFFALSAWLLYAERPNPADHARFLNQFR